MPSAGTVSFRGRALADIDPLQLRRQVGMVFQRPVLFAGTVRDNLTEADGEAAAGRFEAVLERSALDASFLNRPAHELSGGEGQRVCLARALVADPAVLLMDEPTSSLDGPAVGRLESLARRLAEQGISIMWVTHDLEQMKRLADRTVILMDGAVQFSGEVGELHGVDDPALTRFLEGADAG